MDKVKVNTKCPICGKEHPVYVYEQDWEKYKNGELVQNAFPYLNADDREMLITGICPDCWELMFKNKE